MKIDTLTSAEEHIMQIIWQLEKPFMKDIMEHLPEPKPHKNTVSTYLKILTEKKFLAPEKVGRVFRYSVSINFNDYRKKILENLVENFYNQSFEELLDFIKTEYNITETTPNKAIQNQEVKTEISEYIEQLTEPKKKRKKKKKKKK